MTRALCHYCTMHAQLLKHVITSSQNKQMYRMFDLHCEYTVYTHKYKHTLRTRVQHTSSAVWTTSGLSLSRNITRPGRQPWSWHTNRSQTDYLLCNIHVCVHVWMVTVQVLNHTCSVITWCTWTTLLIATGFHLHFFMKSVTYTCLATNGIMILHQILVNFQLCMTIFQDKHCYLKPWSVAGVTCSRSQACTCGDACL